MYRELPGAAVGLNHRKNMHHASGSGARTVLVARCKGSLDSAIFARQPWPEQASGVHGQ